MKGFVWMAVGFDRNNTCRYVDVLKFSVRQSILLSFTGGLFDYTSAFFGVTLSS